MAVQKINTVSYTDDYAPNGWSYKVDSNPFKVQFTNNGETKEMSLSEVKEMYSFINEMNRICNKASNSLTPRIRQNKLTAPVTGVYEEELNHN